MCQALIPRVFWSVVIISFTHQRHFLHQHSQCVVELQYVLCLTLLQHRSSAGPNFVFIIIMLFVLDRRSQSLKRGGVFCVFFQVPDQEFFFTQTHFYIPTFQFLQDLLIGGVHPHTGVHSERGEGPVLPGEEHQESGVVRFPHHAGVESYPQPSRVGFSGHGPNL